MLKKCEFDKARLEAMFSKKHTPKKHVHTTHAHIPHIPTLLNHNIYIHIMLDTLHTPSMFIPHTLIMLLFMVEFIHLLIVAEKVT